MKKIRTILICFLCMLLVSGCSLNSDTTDCTPVKDIFNPPPSSGIIVPDASLGNLGVTTWMVTKMESILKDSSEEIYQAISQDSGFAKVLGACMTLAIAFYGAMIIMGAADAKPYNVFMMLFKLLAVFIFATKWDVFNEIVIGNFENMVKALSGIMTGVFSGMSDTGAIFSSVDRAFSIFFSFGFAKFLMGVIFSGWMGFFIFLIYLSIMISYLVTALYAVKTYVISMIARFLLYAIAPIFFVFALFNQTKSMFESWLEQVISFSMQAIFIMAMFSMFQVLIMGYFDATLVKEGYNVCWSPIIKFGGIASIKWWVLLKIGEAPLAGYQVEYPMDIWMSVSLLIIIGVMMNMMKWSIEIASRLSGGLVGASSIPVQGWETLKAGAKVGGIGAVYAGIGAVRGSKGLTGTQRTGGMFDKSQGGFLRRVGVGIREGWKAGTAEPKENLNKTKGRDWYGGA